MKCKNCENQMIKDDVDFNFKGNYDNYWICENCFTSYIEKIRFGKQFEIIWDENER